MRSTKKKKFEAALMKITYLIFFLFLENLYGATISKDEPKIDEQHILINVLLDGLHEDAHIGDFKSYFNRYSTNAIFLGTDKTERWTIDEFKIYAKPAFEDGHGWTYTVVERNIEGDNETYWFDEILFNKKLGHCRGTGVIQLINDEWKISHYALTMLVPNAIASDVGAQTQKADMYNK